MFTKILVAIDGSDPAKYALTFAAELANRDNAEIVILSVILSMPGYYLEDFDYKYYSKLEDDIQKSYEKLLKEAETEIQRDYSSLKTSIVARKGNAAKNIVDVASEKNVDLIVIGNRGTGGILSWMLGSTSKTVAEACTVPVLIVKDRKFCDVNISKKLL